MGTDINGRKLVKGISQRRDDKRYVAKFTSSYDRRKLISKSFLEYKEAKRWLIEAQYKDMNGLNGSGESVTVEMWMNTFYEHFTQHLREITKKSYKSNLNLINKQIGGRLLTEVKPIHIMKMINSLRDLGYAASSIRSVKTLAYNSFERAVDNGYITSNPVKSIKVSFEETEKVKVLTLEQQNEFLKSIKGSHYEEMFMFMLLTGLRISEVLALRWGDIDYDGRTVRIERNFVEVMKDGKYQYVESPTKSKSSRRDVPLIDDALIALNRQRQKNLNSKFRGNMYDDLIFLSRSGRTCTYANIAKILQSKAKVLRTNGITIERLSTHMLRHTFATRCYESGLSIKTISKILGHSKIETTANIYMHVLPENAFNEINKLEKFMNKGDEHDGDL